MSMILPGILRADGVFLRDGSVKPGSIIRDTGAVVEIEHDGIRQTYKRNEILRVLYGDRYKAKVYIYMEKGRPLHVHIVGETREYYIVRSRLSSAAEKEISKEKVVLVTEKRNRRIERKGRSPFENQIGIRLGVSMQAGDVPNAVTPEVNWNLEPLFFQLYYYERWLEVDFACMPRIKRFWQNYTYTEDVLDTFYFEGDSTSDLYQIRITGYPFRMFNLNLGFNFGFYHYRVDWFRTDNGSTVASVEYSRFLYSAFQTGVTWRFLKRFRISLDVIIPVKKLLTYRDVDAHDNYIHFKQNHPLPGLLFVFTAYVYKNLSLEAGYQFLVHDYRLFRDVQGSSNNPFGPNLKIYSHRITLAVGYGFEL